VHPKILFFDSECLMCNQFVKWVNRKDQKGLIYFSTFSSKKAASLDLKIENNSMVYYTNGIKYERSEAFVEILKELGGFTTLVFFIRIVPLSLRDAVYQLIAINRYRLGKKIPSQSCSVEIQSKIIE